MVATATNQPRMLTRQEAAERLRVHVRTVDKLRDHLRPVFLGRKVMFDPQAIEDFIKAGGAPRGGSGRDAAGEGGAA